MMGGGGVVREKFAVRLTVEERSQLEHLFRAGRSSARVPLKTDEGWAAPRVAQTHDASEGTVFRLKRRYAEDGLDGALKDRAQAHRYRRLEERAEAHPVSGAGQALIALAWGPASGAMSTGTFSCWRTGWRSRGWWNPCPTRRRGCT